MRVLDWIGDFTAEYGGWVFGGLLVLVIVIVVFLIERDEATCAEWGPEREQTTFVWDEALKTLMPQTTTVRDCIRRKQP